VMWFLGLIFLFCDKTGQHDRSTNREHMLAAACFSNALWVSGLHLKRTRSSPV